jgi:KDO2-lipid IV(A) lauroyltransferase
METLRMLTMPEAELRQRLNFTNPELMQKFSQAGTSVFLITSHQFNWEWLIAAVSLLKTHPIHYVYQSQSNAFFDQFSNAIRQRFGAKGVKRDQVAREAIRLKKSLHGLAIVADQFPGYVQDKKYWSVFLNQETAFFQGVQQIAALTNDPVIYFSMRRVSRGHFECDLVPLAEPPYDKERLNVVEGFVRATERAIQNQPDGWLWSHNRWKIEREETSS